MLKIVYVNKELVYALTKHKVKNNTNMFYESC